MGLMDLRDSAQNLLDIDTESTNRTELKDIIQISEVFRFDGYGWFRSYKNHTRVYGLPFSYNVIHIVQLAKCQLAQ